MKPSFDLSVYVITDPLLCVQYGLIETAQAAVRGGVKILQLRDKTATDAALIDQGRALKEALARSDTLLIVNDRVEVARAIGADGVHVGQSDAAAADARKALGPDAIVGLSIQTHDQAAALDLALIDYVGVGPVFATATKPDHAPPLGFEGLKRVCAASALPAVAIGGLSAAHARAVFAAGARGLAVVSGICAAEEPETAARAFVEAAREARRARS